MKPLAQQTILITGSTDGLGKQTALALAREGAAILLHGRNQRRLEKTQREIQDVTGNSHLKTYLADLADLSQVRRLAEQVQTSHPQLDMLINNAGIGSGRLLGARRELSRDGYELRFAVNYLAPFLLTHLLLPSLRINPPSRIIHVGSVGQLPLDFDNIMFERRYNGYDAYRRSKLALVMFTIDLAERLKGEHITVNCVHPASLMNTKMVRETIPFAQTTVEEGLRSVIYLATSPTLDNVTGQYFDQLQQAHAHPQAYDTIARSRLRQISEQLTGLSDKQASHAD
ncbi:3-oxoacyl-ACP reductase [Reticulibacter mediterranei]|uniref:3-oxoacyl-ACP reductase n=1 Tax=Reticulibacter mediterranei TaxID=2778369 RepID=A0A8J3IUH1_9CHLR|nr:SDR family NAD(P)-dependent oxidoreductase [Reticulibacter mediterranei]GHO97110.1 3-oxoacyl-ACP reductase [Reticulibacter mediterranei]